MKLQFKFATFTILLFTFSSALAVLIDRFDSNNEIQTISEISFSKQNNLNNEITALPKLEIEWKASNNGNADSHLEVNSARPTDSTISTFLSLSSVLTNSSPVLFSPIMIAQNCADHYSQNESIVINEATETSFIDLSESMLSSNFASKDVIEGLKEADSVIPVSPFIIGLGLVGAGLIGNKRDLRDS